MWWYVEKSTKGEDFAAFRVLFLVDISPHPAWLRKRSATYIIAPAWNDVVFEPRSIDSGRHNFPAWPYSGQSNRFSAELAAKMVNKATETAVILGSVRGN